MTTRRLVPLLALLLGLNGVAEAGRVIVKYRADTRKTAKASETDSLSLRLGLELRHGTRLDERTEVIHGEADSAALAALIATQPDVEYAVPDQRRKPHAIPDDPRYAGQWYLQSTEVAAIRANQAWDTSTGHASVVIAFIDTGVRYDHPDLHDRLLPGYDVIADAGSANDGDGRDADASDPGDFTADNECDDYSTATRSSWHGTRVAGILGATANNSTGIAGIDWNARLLPVRALGKCGGWDSDILVGLRWAGGLPVPGLPANPTPANVINLSLGSEGGCTSSYQDVIATLANQGTLVVASAGNGGKAVEAPANCPGVLAVAGVRHTGTKVGFSSFGPEVSVSAPAGNCVNYSGLCLFSLDTTSNTGSTVPAEHTYTNQDNANYGTSFSSPMVAATAALMLSVNATLSPEDLIAGLRKSARKFPRDSSLPDCSSGNDELSECNCTSRTCGAGLLDSAAALQYARDPDKDDGGGGALEPYFMLGLSGLLLLAMRRRQSMAQNTPLE